MVGTLFFQSFLEAVFSIVFAILHDSGLQNESKMKAFGSNLLEKVWKRKSVFGLRRRARIAYEPIPSSAQGDPQIEQQNGHVS